MRRGTTSVPLLVLPAFRYRGGKELDRRPICRQRWCADALLDKKEVVGLRNKLSAVNWRFLLYSSATLATMLLAAGARWKPK